MQLISLNTWGGRVRGINEFIAGKKDSTDIFCFQEVHNDSPESEREVAEEQFDFYEKVRTILPDFEGYFSSNFFGVGMVMFIRKNIEVESFDSYTILSAEELASMGEPGRYSRVLQQLVIKESKLSIYNFHGIAGGGKVDNEERNIQCRRVLEIINKDGNRKILTGDFNLNPNTKLITALEKIMQNPLKQSRFKTTRSELYKLRSILPFADYCFLSPGLKVQDFQVLPDVVSDHLALQVEF